jgi:hypothetical protein
MKPGQGIVFGKKRITIDESIWSFLFIPINIPIISRLIYFRFPEIPNFFYSIRPFFYLCLAYVVGLMQIDNSVKYVLIPCLVISSLAILYARDLQKKYDLYQNKIAAYRMKKSLQH